MKRLALIAALVTGPAVGETDAALMMIVNALARTPCEDLTRIVVDNEPRDATERQIRLAAMGVIVGRALAKDPDAVDFKRSIQREMSRLQIECLDYPDKPWLTGMFELRAD